MRITLFLLAISASYATLVLAVPPPDLPGHVWFEYVQKTANFYSPMLSTTEEFYIYDFYHGPYLCCLKAPTAPPSPNESDGVHSWLNSEAANELALGFLKGDSYNSLTTA